MLFHLTFFDFFIENFKYKLDHQLMIHFHISIEYNEGKGKQPGSLFAFSNYLYVYIQVILQRWPQRLFQHESFFQSHYSVAS